MVTGPSFGSPFDGADPVTSPFDDDAGAQADPQLQALQAFEAELRAEVYGP